jgi:hypothetical protein
MNKFDQVNTMNQLFNAYANGLITDDELEEMLGIIGL